MNFNESNSNNFGLGNESNLRQDKRKMSGGTFGKAA